MHACGFRLHCRLAWITANTSQFKYYGLEIPRSMNTLKGVFWRPKEKYRRNFIRENVRQLREMQGYRRNEEYDTVTGRRSTPNTYENVPSRTPYCHHPQLRNNDQNTKEAVTRISSVSEKGHVRAKCSASKTNAPKRNMGNNAIVNGDMAALVHQQHVNVSHESTKKVASSSEMLLDVPGSAATGSERVYTVRVGCRSVGCQTVDPKNFNKLLSEGGIKYPGIEPGGPVNSLCTREVGLQTDMVPSFVSTISNAASDRLISCERHDLDMQNLSLSDHKEVVDEPQLKSPEIDYIKMNVQSVKTRQRSTVQAANNSLKAPPTHQRGAIPKYLRERQEAWQKEAEQRKRNVPDTACPPGHVMLPDSERLETLRMLKKRHAELVQQLNMLPVSMDTLKVRNRKMELEKQLNKLEEGIKVFSRPKVFVKIDA